MQLSVASCQLSVSKATVAGDGPFAAAATATGKKLAPNATFGNVISAKVAAQAGDGRSAPPPDSRTPAPEAGTVSCRKAGSAGLRPEKQSKPEKHNGDQLAPAQALSAAEVLPTYPNAATTQGNFCLQEEDCGKGPATGIANPANGAESALANSCGAAPASGDEAAEPGTAESAWRAAMEDAGLQQQTSVPIPPPETQPYAATQNTRGPDQQETTDRPGNAALPRPGQGQTLTSKTATPESAKLQDRPAAVSPGAARAEAPPQASERRPENDETGAAAAQLTTPTRAELSDLPGRASEAELKPVLPVTPPVNSAVMRSGEAASRRSSDGTIRNARKLDANTTKPPQPSGDATPSEEEPRFTMSDSIADKAHLTQPTATIATHDAQGKTSTPANAVLGDAGRAAGDTADAKDAKPQAASAAPTSTPAENAPAPPAVIQSARVLERMGQSEIRLGLNSNNFGSIELHTRVNQDRVGASIATSHTDLRAAMMAEMPSLERAMAQHQLKLDSFNFDTRTGTQNSDSGSSARNQSPRSPTQSAGHISGFSDETAAEQTAPLQAWTAPHSGGLNVHA